MANYETESDRYQERDNRRQSRTTKLAKFLGWFSIGLGIAELLIPEKIAEVSGLRGTDARFIRSYGVREIGCGIAILASADPMGAIMARVAGDALDLASLGKGFTSRRSRKTKLAIATANVAAVTALDVFCVKQLSKHVN
jgi:hypothetical protein